MVSPPYAYPDDSGEAALVVRFYDGFQYVLTFMAGFVPFSSNLLKNKRIFLFLLKQTDRHTPPKPIETDSDAAQILFPFSDK